MRIKHVLLTIVLSALFLTACGTPAQESNQKKDKPLIAVTIVPQESFLRAIAGDLVEILTIVPPGYSTETYEPSPQDVARLSEADLYFAIGVPVETGQMMSAAQGLERVDLHALVSKIYPDLTFEDHHRDPHIWLSPKRVMVMVEEMVEHLVRLDPSHEKTYRANGEAYLQELSLLDQELEANLSSLENKTFMVYHPAFAYFADDYGLTMFALEEHGKEATPQHLAQMVDLARGAGVRVIFYQEEMDSSQSQAFANEIGGRTAQLTPLSGDYINSMRAMGEAISEANR